MSRTASTFECQSCGYASAKWLGRCPDCGTWNSFVEEVRSSAPGPVPGRAGGYKPQLQRLGEVTSPEAARLSTANAEFDRALGGGIVPGSLVLVGGDPGIGKSTLLLQVSCSLQRNNHIALYVSGEESVQQVKLRSGRVAPDEQRAAEDQAGSIYVLAESNLENIVQAIQEAKPEVVVIDSIQTTYSESLDSAPGSISQVRHVATVLLQLAKTRGISVFLIGHVTKDGTIAGPKALEHIVDAVLYFEGDRHHNHRIVRAVKNRFGAANELGIFEMTSRGLLAVRSPSDLFLSEGSVPAPGSAVTCAVEGTRPILVEVQALVSSTRYSTARRVSTGVDYNRIAVLVAMLEKKLGLHLAGCDIYVKAAGGLQVEEPATDLALVAAILSSFRNRPLIPRTVLIGEMGLSGEVRPVSQIAARLHESAVMAFNRAIVPAGNLPLLEPADGLEVLRIRSVDELSDLVFAA